MATITFEIDIGDGPRTIVFDPEDITLGFLEDLEEAQTSSKWSPLRGALSSLLKLTPEEGRAITIRQFKAISEALKNGVQEQQTLPKEP